MTPIMAVPPAPLDVGNPLPEKRLTRRIGADPTARFLFDFGEDDSNLNPFHLHEGLKTLEIAFQTEPLDEA